MVESQPCSEAEWRVVQENACRHHLGISRDEFIRKAIANEFDWDGPQHCNLMPVLMLFPDLD